MEWWVSHNHCKEDYSQSKYIHCLTIIWELHKKFWSHILVSSKWIFKEFFFIMLSWETEINKFDVLFLWVQHYVFQLDVSVNVSVLMTVVYCFQDLFEVSSSSSFIHLLIFTLRNLIEQITALAKFSYDVLYFLFRFVKGFIWATFGFLEFDDIWMLWHRF